MKTLGLIGGTGWISTVDYYKIINQEVNIKLGGLNSGKILLYSFNYAEINALNIKNDHETIYEMVRDASQKIIDAGADGIVLCANTLHMYAAKLENEIDKPIIHIADAAAKEINKQNFTKIGLLGTKYTMEKDFYTSRLSKAGIEAFVPGPEDRELMHTIIYTELLKGKFLDESKIKILKMIDDLSARGAEGIILGCTEIPLIIKQDDCSLPLFNTLEIHSKAAVGFALD